MHVGMMSDEQTFASPKDALQTNSYRVDCAVPVGQSLMSLLSPIDFLI